MSLYFKQLKYNDRKDLEGKVWPSWLAPGTEAIKECQRKMEILDALVKLNWINKSEESPKGIL